MNKNNHIVFDLDDTLYKEVDFVRSAYKHIINYIIENYNIDLGEYLEYVINKKINFYDFIIQSCKIDLKLNIYLDLYRFHIPEIELDYDTKNVLNKLDKQNILYSIITDGRSISQRNKLISLGICDKVSSIIISQETGFEKPHTHNFQLIQNQYPNNSFVYVGDNTSKDFIAPNKLGWDTVCLLDNGKNIHKQKFDLEEIKIPKFKVKNLLEIFKL